MRKLFLLLSFGVLGVSVADRLKGAQGGAGSAKMPAHWSGKVPPDADAAFPKTTKGGVTYMAYSPRDEFGTSEVNQRYLWWVTEPWTGDDKPYAQMRQAVDAAVKRGANPLGLVARYKKELAGDPWNPRRIYPWAYSSWLARKRVPTREESLRIFGAVSDYMPEARFGGTYQYARMAFLAQSYVRPRFALKHIGDRLLRRNPADEDVKFYMIRVLSTGVERRVKKGGPAELQWVYDPRNDARALAYARYFFTKYPRNPKFSLEYPRTLRYFHSRRYPLKPERARRAISAYREWMRLNPKSPFRKVALAEIQDVKREQQDWDLRAVRKRIVERAMRQHRQHKQSSSR